jgi:hypothetical protein
MTIGNNDQLKEEYVDVYKEWEANCVLSPIEREFIYNILMTTINRVNDKNINGIVLSIFINSINDIMDNLKQKITCGLIFKTSEPILAPFDFRITTSCIHAFSYILASDGYPYDYNTSFDLLFGINSDYIFRNKSDIFRLCDNITNEQKSVIVENTTNYLLEDLCINPLYRFNSEMNISKAIDEISKIDSSVVEVYDMGISNIVEIAVNYMTGNDEEGSINELRKILKIANDNKELFKNVVMLYMILNSQKYSAIIKPIIKH